MASTPGDVKGDVSVGESVIGSGIRAALVRRAEKALAQRSRPGALVYFLVVVLLALSTGYGREHPFVVGLMGALMLIAGLARLMAAQRVLKGSDRPPAESVRLLRATIYTSVVPWGLFCGLTLQFYPSEWRSTFLLLATAALASGLTSSLAPDGVLASRALICMVVPTIASAVVLGDRGYLAFAIATALYLAFLIAQAREHARAFHDIGSAAERERTRNSAVRRRIEMERATLAAAVEQAAEEILITDSHGTIQYCNQAFENASGYSRAEMIGTNPRILKSGRHDPGFYRGLWDTITAGQVWTGTITNRRKDGTLYEAEGSISPIYGASGQLTGFVSALHDVTERLRLESQLRQAQKLESIGRLAGGVAHDFNNLLTVILGYSRVLLGSHDAPGDPDREYLQEITAAGDRAASLTRQLLSFSRKQILMPRPIALNALVGEMRPMLQRLVGEDVRVEVLPSESVVMVRADPDQMSQILMNLAANARDAMPRGGALIIGVAPVNPEDVPAAAPPRLVEGPTVCLSVRDTGMGMNEETRQRLFEPFFTTKEHGQGTGLGLATVYGIVHQSEGHIEVRSELGQGAEFNVYLPRYSEASEEERASPGRPDAEGGSETILVVEDQDDLRRLVSTVLQGKGYRVLDAGDGRDAIRIAEESLETIDLLLTDVIMPDITGKEVADRVRQSRPGIRVLFMSGYSGDVIARRGVLEGGVAYLPKPFTIAVLSAKVREVLDA